MMEFKPRSVRLVVPRKRYGPEALKAGALAVGAAAQVFLDRKGTSFVVDIVVDGKTTRAKLRALAGEFLNECLSHLYRQEVVAFYGKLTAAALAPTLAGVFAPLPADPLEELEPQVKLDREAETAALLDEAGRLA
jgi:hypothetical protein